MKKYIKTTISRDKLYDRNYSRDSIEDVIIDEKVNSRIRYDSLVKVLTSKYLDSQENGVKI
ncbi:hypothetical protein ONV75_18705 [Clostridium sp. LQ25]|uniref:hypothetical protein n=1 Tax=Clostridium TaxID=1485 RepID=UPI00051B5C04|nr:MULTISPECIES: hypothetical protein [Clostridium]APF21632.1 hypothetical protein NPD4_4044 [Clostridium butyricum]QUF85236.1 hypothetical protein KDJ93_19440 [Clostridium butyricum]UZT08634.1 hypothetical protein ONV75_18705 [Clostridium sp. LQ25]